MAEGVSRFERPRVRCQERVLRGNSCISVRDGLKEG